MYLLAFLIFCFLSQTSSSNNSSSYIFEITDRNFHRQTNIHPNLLLLFYSPNCPYCNNVLLEYEHAAKILAPQKPQIILGKINCDSFENKLCLKRNITSLPALKLYKNGKYAKEYQYSRLSWDFVKFMRAQVNPPSREITSIEDFRVFLLEQKDAAYVGFFEHHTHTMNAFFKAAKAFKEIFIFAHSHCENLLRRQRVFDGIVLFRPVKYPNQYEEERVLYEGRPLFGEIRTFIMTNYHGLVGRRTPYNLHHFTFPLTVLYYTSTPKTRFQQPYYWRNRILKVAKKYIAMSYAVSDKEDFKEELEKFGINIEEVTKPIVTTWSIEAKKYKMEAPFSTEAFDKFIADFVDGKLQPYIWSSLAKTKDGEVFIATSSTFNQLVMDNTNDVLIYFYAPWCVHSQNFNPVYRNLAEKLKNENLEMIKIDATANDVPDLFNITDYPTVYWLEKTNKDKPVLYTGPKTVDELIKFVAQRASEELKEYDRTGNEKVLERKKTEL